MKYKIIYLLAIIFLDACQVKSKQIEKKTKKQIEIAKETEKDTQVMLDSNQTIEIEGHLVDILLPEGEIKGNIIILPGWNFPKDDWCKKSSLCTKALAKGFCIIAPEMGKSTYSSEFYPQTRKDWQKYPKKGWVTDTMVTQLQKNYKILLEEQNNFVLGLSTGARGTALLCLDLPNLFTAAAALSGDYDQTKVYWDRIMTGYYGAYQQFPQRWKNVDNIITDIQKWKTPIYLGHSKQDNIVPISQTVLMYNTLRKVHPNIKVKLNTPNGKHDYVYWDSEVDNMLSFFEEVLEEK